MVTPPPHPRHLHRCCGCPEPPGGAHSTDTGPAHGPAVCSLPAAQKHAAPRSDSKTREIQHIGYIPSCIIHTEKELVFQLLANNIACILRLTSQTDKLRQ